ncbi:hypothetical protein JJB07_19710 [Tumebacillus sp. ITR2]|uniref:Uncharacterized protein n=1 Tax=Tumebacillus amylolyticus TaxID=2801339 RepID=A0ABS1JF09_9BACL|nr:hypothetical protein [Tumebacillus amylolyticus]MBL0388833.1 hypothetical protein [Tumebacillus amylolyticus]
MGYRTRGWKITAKRSSGVILASAGLFVVARFLPPEMWVASLGVVLVWVGWVLFKS